ncbi:unnamed protein product [Phytophthora lilii]|uniref:Unnamed protein product n=1 Tax=Phytophthora lilii TaxID=2077276 RepID=A0A9W7CHT9_9STRA|nr:unnamed protein product [Phytophthora lilii]
MSARFLSKREPHHNPVDPVVGVYDGGVHRNANKVVKSGAASQDDVLYKYTLVLQRNLQPARNWLKSTLPPIISRASPAMSSSTVPTKARLTKSQNRSVPTRRGIEHDVTAAPVPGRNIKPKLNPKLITIEKFSSAIRDGYLDAGAYEWLERVKENIADAETFNDRTWLEQAKCSALTSSLIGRASTWYLRSRDALLRASTTKLPLESYDEYTHRLSRIAAGLNRGRINNYTEQQALSTSINHAYRRFRDALLAQLDVEAEVATEELERAIDLLSRLAGLDGRMSRKPYKPSSHDASNMGKKPRTGSAAITAANSQQSRRIVTISPMRSERSVTNAVKLPSSMTATWLSSIVKPKLTPARD